MVQTRRSGGQHSDDDDEDILALMPTNRGRPPRPSRPAPPDSDDSGPTYRPQPRKKYNMRAHKAPAYLRSRYGHDSDSNDHEVVLKRGSSTRPLADAAPDDGTRRSTRRRRMVYDTFNLASIDKYPVAGSQFDDGLARHSRRKTPSPKYSSRRNSPGSHPSRRNSPGSHPSRRNSPGSHPSRRNSPGSPSKFADEDHAEEEAMDMYSRVKRPRRQVKKDMYGLVVADEPEAATDHEQENGRKDDEDDDEGEDEDDEEEETESSSEEEEEGPKQYYLREHRPRTQIFEAAPAPSRITRPQKLMNIIPNSPARRRPQFMSRGHKSPAHRSFRNRRRAAFHGSSSTSSSSSSSSDEDRFERRKAKSMAKSRTRCLPMNLAADDLSGVLKDRQKIGSSLADVDPMNIDRSVTFESVGGLTSNIRALKEMIIFPLMYPEVFDKFHIQPPRGVLFYGPPGTGKTLVARALANECSKGEKRVAFFMRKGADCLSKWVGESERQLRLLFDQAYQMRPSILFFDEIDGLAPVRSSRQDQIHSSIVSTLLALMDGLDSRGEVVVIGATNRIDSIDPALRRPGRFDREFLFPLPSLAARRQILEIHTSRWQPAPSPTLISELAERSVGYCGADLRSLCTEAALFALRRRYPQIYTTSDKLQLDISSIRITTQDFGRAMDELVPASQRAVTSPGRALSPMVLPLLERQFLRATNSLRNVFPFHNTAQDDLVLSDADDDASMTSLPKRSAYRPRFIISGLEGQGQSSHVGPALVHWLEQYPVHVLDLPTLYGVSARSPEESCAQVFREARRTSPSVIYMPHLDQWWQAVTDTLAATFLTLLEDVPPTAPVLLLATSGVPLPDLSAQVQALFWHGGRLVMENPSTDERRRYFQGVFTELVFRPPPRAKPVEELEVLPRAAPPPPHTLSDKEQRRLHEHEDATLRELRLFLRDVINKLGQDRKFAIFTKPVDVEEVDDYYDVIREPMDLSTMMSKIDQHRYQTASDFLRDIDLICSNALEYNPDTNPTDRSIRHRACALRDLARSIIENELDPEFEKRCVEIDQARKTRGQSPSKDAPNFYKVPPKKASKMAPLPKARSQSDPETSQQTTPASKLERKPASDKVRVMSASAYKAMQAKRLKVSPWCRPRRRNRRRIVIVDDEDEEDDDEQTEKPDENKSENESDEKDLTPIEEKTEEEGEAKSPKKSPEKSCSPDKTKLSPSKLTSPLRTSAKQSPESCGAGASPSKAAVHGAHLEVRLEVSDVLTKMETEPSKPRSPARSPRSPARSPRAASPRVLHADMNGVCESGDSGASMPRLSAPSPILLNNEDSNKENDLPEILPDDRKRKRDDSDDTETEAAEPAPASPRVTRYRASHPPPPPLVVDRAGMERLWAAAVEKTAGRTLEQLENLHCQLRACVAQHRHEYNKAALLVDLTTCVDTFTRHHDS